MVAFCGTAPFNVLTLSDHMPLKLSEIQRHTEVDRFLKNCMISYTSTTSATPATLPPTTPSFVTVTPRVKSLQCAAISTNCCGIYHYLFFIGCLWCPYFLSTLYIDVSSWQYQIYFWSVLITTRLDDEALKFLDHTWTIISVCFTLSYFISRIH